mmetsp:Transcript_11556/g.24317  ORF Transcript_11556/g.24317 Transcript_11556/m.24317 type:complete len:603 (-) Transcript_11556:70-1878(-)
MAMAMPTAEDGAFKLYREIFQETSSGDFGVQVKNGPLFRCHTSILTRSGGGFIGKVRQFGKSMSRFVDSVVGTKEYFKEHKYYRLMEDLTSIQFSQPIEQSALAGGGPLSSKREDPFRPGFTTQHFIGGKTTAVYRVDPFFLAERYEVDCDCERMAELLRFIYQDACSFFEMRPESQTEKSDLTQKMLHLTMDSEFYSVDALFEKLLSWFGQSCFRIAGEKNFTEAFYHLQHFELQCTEEHSRKFLVSVVTGDMLASRDQFRAVTQDPRWGSLPVEFIEDTLKYDGMPISNETEVLTLIERWNANTDKRKEDIVRLLCCFRPDEETRHTLISWLTNMGWIQPGGDAVDVAELRGVRKILDGSASAGKPPRRNLRGAEAEEADQILALEQGIDYKPPSEEQEATFVHYKGSVAVAQGCAFSIGSQQRLVQVDNITTSGIQRLRVVLSNPRRTLWDPEHEVFLGLSYGEGKYFGFLCSATAFSGIFSAKALASAAPAPNQPVHLTGSGNKVEFDLALEVQLQRANRVVACKLGVIFANTTLTEELFQISYDTLVNGPGLRFQVVGTGMGDEEVDVHLAWVGGGGKDDVQEVGAGPFEYSDFPNA